MNLIIEAVSDAPAGLLEGQCRYSAARLAPHRLVSAGADPRWDTRWTVARLDGRVVGAVTSHQPRTSRFVNDAYDLAAMAGSLGGAVPDDPRRWVFVGGCRDFAAGVVTSAQLPEQETAQVRSALAGHVFSEAEAAGDYPVALYVREPEAGSFTAGLAGRGTAGELGETAEILLVGADEEEHIAALRPSQRERCRRDRRKFAALGYAARCVPAEEVLAEAAPLVCAVKAKYGVTDHPRLCEYRLREWATSVGAGKAHASEVRDGDGRLLAVSFMAVQGDVLEGYEIGLADEVEGREFAYLQAMIHGPVRFAFAQGCRSIDLGLDSSTVKQRRGAVIGKTWAISLA
ncbi:GNAT family N-acetyltransferase [Streptomyces sp. NPDC015127]|uniref:GNAT family N-acetyltransferase n=1 Tax=Streptomyces sp. NPDC015127 TaxID=3364939 RepID=UPI0036F5A29C